MRSLIAFMFIMVLAVSGAQTANADERTREAQSRLQELGYEVSVDGVYGEGTERAVRQFQNDHGISPANGELNSRDARGAVLAGQRRQLAAAITAATTRNLQCRDSVTATGYRRIGEGRAKSSAERAWSNKVGTLNGYGLAYTDLKLARDPQVACIKACAECTVSKVCTITAAPCRTSAEN